MNNFRKTFMALLMISVSGLSVQAIGNVSNSGVYVTTVVQTTTNVDPESDPYHREENDRGNRAPSRPISCKLDYASGIEFLVHETPDFILYEIYDSNNTCVGAYGDEPEFIDALFSLTGEYRISHSTAEVSYTGYIIL